MRKLGLIMLLGFAGWHPAAAQEADITTVRQLRQACLGEDQAAQARCIDYLVELAGQLRRNGEQGTGPDRICPQNAPSPTHLALLFANWAEANPQLGNQPRQTAARAFTEAWPCR